MSQRLVLTSCLFASIVVHAFYVQHALYHHVFLGVTVCSVIRYSTDNWWVWKLDTVMAHLAFLSVCCDWTTPRQRPWVLAFPLAVAGLWLAETPTNADRLHAALHLVTVAGLHCYLYAP
jgi:hypothetical protein